MGFLSLKARISANSAKPYSQRGQRPSKHAKSINFRILNEADMNFKSTKSTRNGIGPNQTHPYTQLDSRKHVVAFWNIVTTIHKVSLTPNPLIYNKSINCECSQNGKITNTNLEVFIISIYVVLNMLKFIQCLYRRMVSQQGLLVTEYLQLLSYSRM